MEEALSHTQPIPLCGSWPAASHPGWTACTRASCSETAMETRKRLQMIKCQTWMLKGEAMWPRPRNLSLNIDTGVYTAEPTFLRVPPSKSHQNTGKALNYGSQSSVSTKSKWHDTPEFMTSSCWLTVCGNPPALSLSGVHRDVTFFFPVTRLCQSCMSNPFTICPGLRLPLALRTVLTTWDLKFHCRAGKWTSS